jgi:ABC-type multidrug transport system fused ATPase/permease subunit
MNCDGRDRAKVIGMLAIAGRASFVIAHRLSTIRHCDQTVQIEGGRVVGTDGREQLVWRASGAEAGLN